MKNLLKAVKALNNSTIFSTIAAGLGYERVALNIVDKGKIIASFTSYNKEGKIVQVKEGLDDPAFITTIEKDIFEQFTSTKELAWMDKHPVLAVKKYLAKVQIPFTIKLRIGKLFLKGLAK